MLAAFRRIAAVAGAVSLGAALALAAQPALLTELARPVVDAVVEPGR